MDLPCQVELEKIQIFCEEFETMKEKPEAVGETKSLILLTNTTIQYKDLMMLCQYRPSEYKNQWLFAP